MESTGDVTDSVATQSPKRLIPARWTMPPTVKRREIRCSSASRRGALRNVMRSNLFFCINKEYFILQCLKSCFAAITYQIKHYFDFSNCKFTRSFLVSAIWRGSPCWRSSDDANTDWGHCRVKWQTELPAISSQHRRDVGCATVTTGANVVTMSPDVALLAGYICDMLLALTAIQYDMISVICYQHWWSYYVDDILVWMIVNMDMYGHQPVPATGQTLQNVEAPLSYLLKAQHWGRARAALNQEQGSIR